MEGFIPVNGSAGNSAPVGGRRHHLKKVSAKTIKRTLRKLGMKPKSRMVLRGGEMEEEAEKEAPMMPAAGGRRRRHGGTKKRSASRRKGLGVLGL